MKVIIFNSIKGGVGKSTLAAQTIAYLSSYAKVGVFDADPQQTISTWIARRAEANPEGMQNIAVLPLDVDLSQSDLGLDYVVIDSTGIDSEIGRKLLLEAGFVVSPLRPSQADIDTLLVHNELIQGAKVHNAKIKLFYVLNACSTNWRDKERGDSLAVLKYLVESNTIQAEIIENPIFDRAILRSTFSEGYSCFDVKGNKSQMEIKAILDIIFGENE